MPTSTSNSPLRKRAQNLHALDGVNLAVQVAHVDADVAQVIGQFLGGALGERGDQHALLGVGALAAFVDEIVDLALQRLERDLRVNQAGGADDLFDDAGPCGPLQFARARAWR